MEPLPRRACRPRSTTTGWVRFARALLKKWRHLAGLAPSMIDECSSLGARNRPSQRPYKLLVELCTSSAKSALPSPLTSPSTVTKSACLTKCNSGYIRASCGSLICPRELRGRIGPGASAWHALTNRQERRYQSEREFTAPLCATHHVSKPRIRRWLRWVARTQIGSTQCGYKVAACGLERRARCHSHRGPWPAGRGELREPASEYAGLST